MVCDENILTRYDYRVFEGSQGILLDQRFGIMPYCTPSNTTSQNAYELLRKAGIRKEIQTCYVTRPYITRHGNGPFPSVMFGGGSSSNSAMDAVGLKMLLDITKSLDKTSK